MNAYELLTEVRANVNELIGTEKHWTDREILRKLNFSYRKVYFMMSMTKGDRLVTSTDLTPVASVVTLPSDFAKFFYMEVKETGEEITLGTIRERRVDREAVGAVNSAGLSCYFVGDTLEINADSYTEVVTLWYEKKFVDMTAGQGATGSGSNAIKLELGNGPSLQNDYYNGIYFEIVSGTGLGTLAAASDYAGATYTATIAGTFDTTSIYGTRLLCPAEAEEFIVLDATLLCLAKPSAALDPKYFEFYANRAREAKKDLETYLSSRRRGNSSVRMTET